MLKVTPERTISISMTDEEAILFAETLLRLANDESNTTDRSNAIGIAETIAEIVQKYSPQAPPLPDSDDASSKGAGDDERDGRA